MDEQFKYTGISVVESPIYGKVFVQILVDMYKIKKYIIKPPILNYIPKGRAHLGGLFFIHY